MPKNASGFLTMGSVSPRLSVPKHIKAPEYVGRPAPTPFTGTDVKTPEQIEKIRAAGKIAAGAIEMLRSEIAPGVSTVHTGKIGPDQNLAIRARPRSDTDGWN